MLSLHNACKNNVRFWLQKAFNAEVIAAAYFSVCRYFNLTKFNNPKAYAIGFSNPPGKMQLTSALITYYDAFTLNLIGNSKSKLIVSLLVIIAITARLR